MSQSIEVRARARTSAYTWWVLGTATAALSVAHLIQVALTGTWHEPLSYVMTAYDDVTKRLLDWIRPEIAEALIKAQFELGWSPVVAPVFSPFWRHTLIALLLYFGALARTSWLYGDRRRALFRGIFGVIVAFVIATSAATIWYTYTIGPDGAVASEILAPGSEARDAAWNNPLWMALHSQVVPKLLVPMIGLGVFQVMDGLFSSIVDREPGQSRIGAFLRSSAMLRLIIPLLSATGILFVLATSRFQPTPQAETALGFFVVLYMLVLAIIIHIESAIIDATRWRQPNETWWSAFSGHYEINVVRRIAEVAVVAALFFATNAVATPVP